MATKNLWAARDENGDLYLFSKKPTKLTAHWVCLQYASTIELDPSMLSIVKWEDSKPTKVKLFIDK